MTCPHCAHVLPDDANYCSDCGREVRVAGRGVSVQREICEIYRSQEQGGWFHAGDTYWEAIAIGPKGRYTVGRSVTCPRKAVGSQREVKHADAVLDQLIAEIVQEGWQPLPRGPEWYSYRFERQARDSTEVKKSEQS
jgi:hypothetical protein